MPKRRSLLAAMILSVLAVAAIAAYDERLEQSSALADFAVEQSALADAVADGLEARLAVKGRSTADLATSLRRLEQPGRVVILLAPPRGDLVRTDGTPVALPPIATALAQGARAARLTREESASLGLPARTSMGGIATAGFAPDDRWTVVVIATAQAERDRQLRAEWRLMLGVAVAVGLVLAFGGLALRMQRKEIELEARQRRDERLVRADKLATMGALATGIAHEVSTPLGVILGRAEQLKPKVASDDRARRAVDAIVEQGERIGRVIRGFLSLARGEAPAFEHVEPSAIARASVDLVEHRFAQANVELRSEVAAPLPLVACEPRLLEQAVVNLLLNACDACVAGGHVDLAVHLEGDRVAFVVTDDGQGIAAESAARVGEPFFTTKPAGRGTGLGLAITGEIVKHHRGTLAIEPRQDAPGTCACIEIPAALRDDEQPAVFH